MNAVYIHIPKSAGKATVRALGLQRFISKKRAKLGFSGAGKVTFSHQLYPELVRDGIVSTEFDDTAFKFAFCRNPYDRAVSHWQYTMRRHPDRLARGTSFLDFTRQLGRLRDWIPQHTWVDGVDLDFLGRFERLEEDLYAVAEMIEVKIPRIPVMNSTKHDHYSTYYCDESWERIEEYYAHDFERFNYERNRHEYLQVGN